ncbi:hypothetical protein [Actinoplanes sichuanensis]|uniref:Integral membrane protein n=1 Tax=Actinoplanes sichuanensis TaxID=512349 RepID=A0ABW3ZZF1_9ACTN|nr:hypothetical protein [Actinoplanes sichuanensis]
MVEIPVEVLEGGGPVAGVCVLHGLPAVEGMDFVIKFRPDTDAPGNQPDPRTVRVREWPLCAACARRRVTGRAAAAALLFGGLATIVVAAVVVRSTETGSPLAVLPFLVGFGAATVLWPWPYHYGSWERLARMRMGPDGTTVHIDSPNEEFHRQLTHRLG